MAASSGNDTNTVTLLHLNGSTADTAIGGTGTHAWTSYNSFAYSAATYKLGATGAVLNGTGAYADTPHHDDFAFGTGNVTIDFWMRANSTQIIYSTPLGTGTSLSNSDLAWTFQFGATSSSVLSFYWWGGTLKGPLNSLAQLEDAAWHHIALVRNATNLTMYVDGVPQGTTGSTTLAATFAFSPGTKRVAIGRRGEILTATFAGFIDEVRISKTARWTATFTPPVAEYGQGLTHDLGDSSSLGDSILRNPRPVKADTISSGDVILKNASSIKTDIFSLGDAISNKLGKIRTDILSLADSISNKPSLLQADSIALSDVSIKSFNLNKSDIISLADDLSKKFGLSKSDIFTLVDFFSYFLQGGMNLSLSDDIYLSDVVKKSPHIFKPDTISILDQVIKSYRLNRHDFIFLSDIVSLPALPAAGIIFEFVHKKRTEQIGEQGVDFNFEHKKRLNTLVQNIYPYLQGAFADSFDPDSFFVIDQPASGITPIKNFLFKHIG